jgi:spermidine synthase
MLKEIDNELYFFEDELGIMKLGYKVREILYQGVTEHNQEVLIFDSEAWGKTLVIDGLVQSSSDTSFLFNEIMVHTTLDFMPDNSDVLIIGGGTGLTVKESLKHNPKSVVLCELSDDIMRLCREYMPEYMVGLDNEAVEFVIEDGSKYVTNGKQYDAIMVDSCDPVGDDASSLFTSEFYLNCMDALKEHGLLCVQVSGNPFFSEIDESWDMLIDFIRTHNLSYRPVYFNCPMIIGGMYLFVLMAKADDFDWDRNHNRVLGKTKYYDNLMREMYFILPTWLRNKLYRGRI